MKKKTAVLTMLIVICMFMTIIGVIGCTRPDGGKTSDPVRNVTISPTQITLDRYENVTLTATVTDEEGNAVSDAVTWSTSNAAVATVSNGFVQATGEGSADITAAVGTATATCKVTVENSGMEPVLSLNAESASVVVGGEFTVTGAVMYNRVEQTDAVITYAIEDTNIATVDGEGNITGVSYGSTTLTVSASWRGVESSFLTKQIPVTVKEDISLNITGTNATIYLKNTTVEGEEFSNTVTYTGTVLVAGSEDGVDDSKIGWKSSDETIATVEDGVVTATGSKEGSVQITLTYTGEEVYESAPVTVTVAMPTLDKTDEITLYLDANAADTTVGGQITAAEVFGAETDKTIARIANNDDTATDISENATWITERDTGSEDERTYTLAVYNDEYGCLVNAVVATKVITTYAELADMQEYGGVTTSTVDDGGTQRTYYNYSGYFVLGNDIVAQPSDPVMAADSRGGLSSQGSIVMSNGFTGTFNGNGHTLYNFKMGLGSIFGDLGSGSVVKNVAVVNATLTESTSGVFAFTACGATFENVFVSMTAQAYRNGIVGRYMNGGSLKDVVIYCNLGDFDFVGAIVDWMPVAASADNVYVVYSSATKEERRKVVGDKGTPNGTVTEYDEEDLASASFSGLPEGWYVAEGGYPMFESSIGGMYISQTTLTGTVGGQGSLQGYVYGASQSDNIGLPVVWKSDDTQVVQVSQTGAYEFVGEGSTTITVTYGKFKATCTVEVDAAAVQIVDRTGTTLDVEANSTTGLGTQIVNAGVEAELFDTFTPTAVYFESAPDTDYNDDYGTETGFFATYDTGNETARTLTLIVADGDTALYRVKVLVVTKIITTYDGLTKMQEYGGVTTAQVTDGTATRTYHNYSGYFVLGGNIIVGAEEDALEVGSRESLSSQGSINANYGFSGVFDGRGYTISGLKVHHSGLFGDLATGSVIKNVAFNNVTVTGNTDNSGAGVIGYTSCGATIENVFISMSTSSARSGAIAGRYMRGGTLKNVVICYEKTGGYSSGAVSCWTAGALTVENVYVIYTTTTPEADRKLAGEQTFLSNGTVTEYDEEDLATAEFSGLPEGWYVAEGGYPMFESSIGGMYISQTTLTGTVGGQGSLQGYVYGASQSDNIGLPVVWKSDDTQVVQVSQTGAYEFVGEGSATITVTYGKFKATCTVEVDAAAVQIVDKTGTTLDVESNSTTGLGTQIVNAGVDAGLFDTFTPTAVYFESAPDTDYNDDYGTETGFFATYDTGNETARTLTLIVANGDTALYRVKVLVITKIITSYAELAALQSYTEVTEGENAGGATYYSYGGYFVLANNLVATGEEAAFAAQSMGSISSGGHTTNLAGFHGTFDGRGYTVSGFKYALGGIFGDVGNDAVIKNVAFVNCIANDIDYAATETRVDGIGILAVNACGSFLVDNVLVSASVNSPNGGALFGRSTHSGTISNTVIRVNQTAGWNIGAISGWNVYTIGTFLENVYVIFEGSSNRIFGNQELDATTYKEGSTVTTMTVEEIATTSFTGLSDTYWTVTEGEMPTFNSMADIESA